VEKSGATQKVVGVLGMLGFSGHWELWRKFWGPFWSTIWKVAKTVVRSGYV